MKDLSRTGPASTAGPAEAGLASHQDAAELVAAIRAFRRTSRRALRKVRTDEPLPASQRELLGLVEEHPGITVAEAAAELVLAPNTVSTLVGRLTEQDLLLREKAWPDGRSVRLTVTDKARKRIAGYRDLRAEVTHQAMAQLTPADQRALAEAVPALARLTHKLALA